MVGREFASPVSVRGVRAQTSEDHSSSQCLTITLKIKDTPRNRNPIRTAFGAVTSMNTKLISATVKTIPARIAPVQVLVRKFFT